VLTVLVSYNKCGRICALGMEDAQYSTHYNEVTVEIGHRKEQPHLMNGWFCKGRNYIFYVQVHNITERRL